MGGARSLSEEGLGIFSPGDEIPMSDATLGPFVLEGAEGGGGSGPCGGPGYRHSGLHAQAGQPGWATGSRVCLLRTRTEAKPKFLEEGKKKKMAPGDNAE